MAEDNDSKIFLIVIDNCPYCEQAKKLFKPEIDKGEISLLKPEDPKFSEIERQLVITKVPACVVEDTKNKKYYYCSEEEAKKQMEGVEKPQPPKKEEPKKGSSSLFSW